MTPGAQMLRMGPQRIVAELALAKLTRGTLERVH